MQVKQLSRAIAAGSFIVAALARPADASTTHGSHRAQRGHVPGFDRGPLDV